MRKPKRKGRRVHSRPPSAIERTFYARFVRQLIEKRNALGQSQRELDDRIGLTEGQIAKWESFDRMPGAFYLMLWAKALGMSIVAAEDQFKGS